MASQAEGKRTELDPADELRAQYVACSYLATACHEALRKLPAAVDGADPTSLRVLELMLAIEWDWQRTLQELGQRLGGVTGAASDRPVGNPMRRRYRRPIVRVA